MEERVLFALVMWASLVLTFWLPCAALEAVGTHPWWRRRVISRRLSGPRSKAYAAQVRAHVVLLPVLYAAYPVFLWGGMRVWGAPEWSELPVLILVMLWQKTSAYFLHRFLHTPYMYRWHKQHHAFVVPSPSATQYVHPVDGLLLSVIPDVVPVVLAGLRCSTACAWLGFWQVMAVCEHSCYDVTWLPGSAHHAHHHLHNRGNYGSVFVPWDRWLGTTAPVHRETKTR